MLGNNGRSDRRQGRQHGLSYPSFYQPKTGNGSGQGFAATPIAHHLAPSGVAGFVLPNDTVDVLLTRTPKTESEGQIDPITDVLLQNVRVIAIDQGADDKNNQPVVGKTATLLVDQQGAQKLALASNVGSLSLALRNAANQDVFMAQTVGTRDLGQGSVSPSFYNQPRSGTAAMASSPYPIPAMQAAAIGQARNAAGPVRRKPANSVEVEIVRGTASSSYDVSRHRGY